MSKRTLSATLLAMALVLAGCGGAGDDAAPADAAADVELATPSHVEQWTLPATLPGSSAPSLSVTPDGRLLLGWINSQKGRRHIFQFSSFAPDWGRWMHAMSTVAVGHSMFVNWADVPHLAATPDGALWAHWLQTSGEAAHAYDVVLTRSRDGGGNWAAPVMAHDDRTRTEHGFVSMWAQGADTLGIAWLDGRNTGAGHDGATALRAAVFDPTLAPSHEVEIDPRVCDCCQTSVAVTAKGALLVYRGRSTDEVRDIHATRFDGTGWTPPAPVHADGWVMAGCPVNGPDVAASGNAAVVAWYTEAGGAPQVRAAASADAGDSFAAPVTLDAGAQVLGRVAVALDSRQAWLLWLREEAGVQSLWLSRRSPDLAVEYERIEVGRPAGLGRATGFPQLALAGGAGYVVWTDVADGVANLRGVRIVRGP